MSYTVVTIEGRDTNYLALQKLLKKIYKRDARICTDINEYPGLWAVYIKGKPDKRLTMLQLHHQLTIVEADVEEISSRYRVLDLEKMVR